MHRRARGRDIPYRGEPGISRVAERLALVCAGGRDAVAPASYADESGGWARDVAGERCLDGRPPHGFARKSKLSNARAVVTTCGPDTFFMAVPPVLSDLVSAPNAPNRSGRGGRTANQSSTRSRTTSCVADGGAWAVGSPLLRAWRCVAPTRVPASACQ
jgi:hypothetical protein